MAVFEIYHKLCQKVTTKYVSKNDQKHFLQTWAIHFYKRSQLFSFKRRQILLQNGTNLYKISQLLQKLAVEVSKSYYSFLEYVYSLIILSFQVGNYRTVFIFQLDIGMEIGVKGIAQISNHSFVNDIVSIFLETENQKTKYSRTDQMIYRIDQRIKRRVVFRTLRIRG